MYFAETFQVLQQKAEVRLKNNHRQRLSGAFCSLVEFDNEYNNLSAIAEKRFGPQFASRLWHSGWIRILESRRDSIKVVWALSVLSQLPSPKALALDLDHLASSISDDHMTNCDDDDNFDCFYDAIL